MAEKEQDRNKQFIKGDPGMGIGAIVTLVFAAIAVFGGLAYFLMKYGHTLAVR